MIKEFHVKQNKVPKDFARVQNYLTAMTELEIVIRFEIYYENEKQTWI